MQETWSQTHHCTWTTSDGLFKLLFEAFVIRILLASRSIEEARKLLGLKWHQVKTVTRMLKEGLLSYCDYQKGNAAIEGLNSKLQTVPSNVRDHRSFEGFSPGILFYCRTLDRQPKGSTEFHEEPVLKASHWQLGHEANLKNHIIP